MTIRGMYLSDEKQKILSKEEIKDVIIPRYPSPEGNRRSEMTIIYSKHDENFDKASYRKRARKGHDGKYSPETVPAGFLTCSLDEMMDDMETTLKGGRLVSVHFKKKGSYTIYPSDSKIWIMGSSKDTKPVELTWDSFRDDGVTINSD
jgi:hypothetical protein